MVCLGILLLRQPLTVAQDRAVTFVQLTDSHVFDSGKRGTPEQKVVEKRSTDLAWKWALDEVTRLVTSGEHIDFVVFTGDLGLEELDKACPPNGRIACDAWKTAVNRVYEDFKALPIKWVFIVRGNNDLTEEDPTPERRRLYTDFVMQVSGKLKEAAKTSEVAQLVDLTPEDPVLPSDFNGVRLVGLDSSSFKNTPKNPDPSDLCMERVNVTEWDKVAASRSSAYQRGELDRVDALTRDSGPALIFTHIPDLADPFRVRNCKTRFASWTLVSTDRDLWRRIAARQSVIALFAGHFHDDDRDTYRRPYRLLVSPGIDPGIAEKTYVAPPLAAKFQGKPQQARGFLVASVQGGRVNRAEFHWFNAVEAVHLSSDLSNGLTSTAEEAGMEYTDIALIFMIIVVAGAFGGFVNYMLLLAKEEIPSESDGGPPGDGKKLQRWHWASLMRRPLFGSVTLGIAASLMVPLFLKTISSDLITTLSKYKHGSGIPFEFFSFTGFCVLAAIFSQRFLDTLSKRLLADVKKVKEESQEASATASTVAERLEQAGPVLRRQMEALTEEGTALSPKSKDVAAVPETFEPILKALLNPKWSYRTVNGIAKERELAPDSVRQTLQQMRQDGFAQRLTNSEPELWFLTDKGYDLAIAKKLTPAGQSDYTPKRS